MAKAYATRSFYCQANAKSYREDDEYKASDERVKDLVNRGLLRDPVYDDGKMPEASEATRETADRDLSDVSYRDLQQIAKDHGIKATQSAEELRAAISEARE